MCLYPKLILNRKYLPNKKNKGVVPPLPLKNGRPDERVKYVSVGCQKCMECLKKKGREWLVRLSEEIKEDKNVSFVTLTFSNKSLIELDKIIGKRLSGYEKENEIVKIAVRRFLERWRKETKKSVKHWLVTELGGNGTERIHIHGLIWNKNKKFIEKKWQYGHIYVGDYVNENTIKYIVKYLSKPDEKHKEYKPIIRASKGLGINYLKSYSAEKNKYKEEETEETYRLENGTKIGLPMYYRTKIYSDEEREKLWQKKLDEEVRYINGIKINANDEKRYNKILKYERARAKKLGYGDDSINWERKKYENKKRNLARLTRLYKKHKK